MSEDSETTALSRLQRALDAGRLGHGLLISGPVIGVCRAVALDVAASLLGVKSQDEVLSHPDFHQLSPRKKSRTITVGENSERTGGQWPTNTMRRFLLDLTLASSGKSGRKVGLISEADRMNANAANAFLKMLEEPPRHTFLFLVSERPDGLLATIRSRCMNLRLPEAAMPLEDLDWVNWLGDYETWLRLLTGPGLNRKTASELVVAAFGLVSRFELISRSLTDDLWEKAKNGLPETMSGEDVEGEEVGVRKSLRNRLFRDIEERTYLFGLSLNAESAITKIAQAVEALENAVRQMELQLDEATALESFLLRSLRIWTR